MKALKIRYMKQIIRPETVGSRYMVWYL